MPTSKPPLSYKITFCLTPLTPPTKPLRPKPGRGAGDIQDLAEEGGAIGNNILLNAFDIRRPTLVITDASGDGFDHILL